MNDIFNKVIKWLKLLLVILITSSEAERSFLTLKRIKTYLRSTIGEDRLNALRILSIEYDRQKTKDVNFNKNVIYNFFKSKTDAWILFTKYVHNNFKYLIIYTTF